MKHFPLGATLALAMALAGGSAQAASLTFLDDTEDEYSSGLSSNNDRQTLVIFWLPLEPGFAQAIATDVRPRINRSRIKTWVDACELETGTDCQIHNIIWLMSEESDQGPRGPVGPKGPPGRPCKHFCR
jgi:hypothetical protein